MPRPIVTGSISRNTCRTRGSRQSSVEPQAEVDLPQRRGDHRHLHDCRDQPRDRVGVDRRPWKCGVQHDQQTRITRFQTTGASAGIENSS